MTSPASVALLVLLLAVGSSAVLPGLSKDATDNVTTAVASLFRFMTSWFTPGDEGTTVGFESPPTIPEAIYIFSQNLLMEYRKIHADSNVVYSPVSFAAALSMVYFGADGDTKALMETVLGFHNGVVPDALKAKDDEKLKTSKVVSLANRAFFAESITVKDSYVGAIGKKNLEVLPFATKPAIATKTINQFVSDATKGLIPDIVSDSQITTATEMVLVNAIYFKGSWESAFPVERTALSEFRGVTGASTVEFMTFGQFIPLPAGRIEELDSKVLELPYSHPSFSMFIVLPNTDEGWREVETKLSEMSPTFFLDAVFPQTKVQVKLPKWDLETDIAEATEILMRMGLKRLFTNPDLSGISDASLALTDVIHKAKITVDEEGTEAAAATAVISSRSAPLVDEFFRFVADHPFLYFIFDKNDNTILFQGTVTELRTY